MMLSSLFDYYVTPLAGVWIEISTPFTCWYTGAVTPLAGVWIEILILEVLSTMLDVTPLAGVWIEIKVDADTAELELRHSPCGSVDWNLKKPETATLNFSHSPCGSVDWNLYPVYLLIYRSCHSPCGSVDWNTETGEAGKQSIVTPLAGVWIEIVRCCHRN